MDIRYTDDMKIEDTELINKILEIDAIVYPKKMQGTFAEVYDRFNANRDMFILLCDKENLIGYMCLFPIKEELYSDILNSDNMFDSNIPGELLRSYEKNNTYKLYLISAAILPEYQKKGLSGKLLEGYYDYLLDKRKNGILFTGALSTAISKGGESLLKKMGFSAEKPVMSEYTLYGLLINDAYYELIEAKRGSEQ